MSCNITNNGQLSPKENPVNSRLVKDGKTGKDKNSTNVLKEIIHKAVTFTPKTIECDTAELNNAITCGYEIHDYVETDTGIVYILTKWGKASTTWLRPDDSGKSSSDDLKGYYDALFREDRV